MIRFSNVSKAYHGATQPALQGLNFHLPVGSMTYLVGHSGAGKSTLLKLIMGMEKANAGNIWFNGHDITRLSKYEIPFLRRQIGMVHQDYRLLTDRSVAENVALPLLYTGKKRAEIKERVSEVLSKVGLAGYENKLPKNMSGGQQQRVSIARAIATNPKFLIADEPTGALDTQTSQEIMNLFKELNRESHTTIILVTHDPHVAEQCERVVTILDGHMIKDKRNEI